MTAGRRYGVSILVLFITWIIVAQIGGFGPGIAVGVLAGILTWALTAPRARGEQEPPRR